MVFVLDTEIDEEKKIFLALQNIFGIGCYQAKNICKKLGFSYNLKIKNLSKEKRNNLINNLKNLEKCLSNDLKTVLDLQLKKKIYIKSYKGLRRLNGMPIRGQKTRSNAKTTKKLKLML